MKTHRHLWFSGLAMLALGLLIAWLPAPRQLGAGATDRANTLPWQELLRPDAGGGAAAAGLANPAVDGRVVRLPGYVVPLDRTHEGLREFLLVPSFGACIHVPPPPPDQIVLVRLDRRSPQWRTMDAVWVEGTLRVHPSDSSIAASSYAIDGAAVTTYP